MNISQDSEIEVINDENEILCHVIFRLPKSGFIGRKDLSGVEEFLQLGIISGSKGSGFRPHVHLERSTSHDNFRAQESWVVVRGAVEADFYSDRGNLLASTVLKAGDVSVSFRGGHGYKLIEDSLVYEFKTGPYLGQAVDKKFID